MSETKTAGPLPADIIKAMLDLRDQRSQLKKAFEESDRVLRKKYERGENWLLQHMQETGHDKFSAGGATVYTSMNQRTSIPDWNAFCDYIRETGQVDLLQKRISSTNLKELMKDSPTPPPGVAVEEVVSVNIRKQP